MKISASILAANPLYLGDSIKELENEGVDFIHVDIMDGHYVNNLTFGVDTVKSLCRMTNIPVEVHLELSNPEDHIENFANAGASIITVMLDTCANPIRVLEKIRKLNIKSGLSISPHVSVDAVKYLENYIDYLLLLSVEPGFGGQKFQTSVYSKIKDAKKIIGNRIPIEIDGGVNTDNISKLVKAGADIFIIGTGLYNNGNLKDNLKRFNDIMKKANID